MCFVVLEHKRRIAGPRIQYYLIVWRNTSLIQPSGRIVQSKDNGALCNQCFELLRAIGKRWTARNDHRMFFVRILDIEPGQITQNRRFNIALKNLLPHIDAEGEEAL